MKKFVYLLLIAGLGAGAFFIQRSLNRQTAVLYEARGIEQSALSSAEQAYGPFRGFLGLVLQWKIYAEKENGNAFEVMNLSRLLSALQRQNAELWAFQAANIVYNLASYYPDADERYKTVKNGLDLLLFDAQKVLKNNSRIRLETGKILFHKFCGGSADPYSRVFREKFAREMARAFPDGTYEDVLLARELSAHSPRSDSRLQPLFEAVLQETGIDVFAENAADSAMVLSSKTVQDTLMKEAYALLRRYRAVDRMCQRWAPDFDRMLEVERQFGPFDWRLPYAHAACYLAPATRTEMDATRIAEMNDFFSLMRLNFERGKLAMNPNLYTYIETFDFRTAPILHDYLHTRLEAEENPDDDPFLRSEHDSFVEMAIAVFYLNNLTESAYHYYEHAVEDLPEDERPTFDAFIEKCTARLMQTFRTGARESLVETALYQGYLAYRCGDEDRAAGYIRLARMLWEKNQKEDAQYSERLLPPWPDLTRRARARVDEIIR